MEGKVRRNKKGRFKKYKQYKQVVKENKIDKGKPDDEKTYEIFNEKADYDLLRYLNSSNDESDSDCRESVIVNTCVDFNNNEEGISVHQGRGTEENNEVLQGRRIIDIGHFAAEMKRGCCMCSAPLQLADCTKELKYGLASIFYIRCKCGEVNSVATGKRDNSRHNGQGPYHINTKLGVALYHAGIGDETIEKIFAVLNIPCISHSSLKVQERKVGHAIEKIAHDSCNTALEREVQESSEGLCVSFDAGWQKRGSGRNYNSLSGHSSMYGCQTNKIVGYDVMCKSCRICDEAAKKGDNYPREHDCRKNWGGSAKGMEPAMAVNIIKNIHDKGHTVKQLVMDDDATTISKVRNEIDIDIEKLSDKNHNLKNFTNSLYCLQKEHKLQKVLSTKTINHIKKCYSYAVATNRNNANAMKDNLLAIPHHLYGSHEKCSSTWCRYLQSPDTYIPQNLPYCKYLSNPVLFDGLLNLFTRHAENSPKLSTLESTQSNESFNQMVSTKNPKNKFFSGSESTSVRVAASVCQKNLGEKYLLQTNEELVLSPGKHTKQYVEKKERKRAREESMRQTREFKRRRRELKSTETRKTRASEIREGVTYQTNVDNDGYAKSATEEIPPPPVTPHEVPLQRKEYTRIYFDLETTGLGLSDITQISAVYKTTEFSMYVIPESPIQASASRVTGLTYDGTTMFKNGIPVPCHPIQHVLEEFNTWLQQFENPLLFAHNAKKFDSRVLCYAINKVNDAKLVDSICGFCDTLLLCKDVLPGHDSYSQENLVKNVLHLEYNAHDATEDCKMLQTLVEGLKIFQDHMYLKHTFSVHFILESLAQCNLSKHNLETLKPVIEGGFISSNVAKKIANSGLSLYHVKLSFDRNGSDGVHSLFSELTVDGKVRVTNRKNIVSSLCKYFQE